MEFPLTNLMEGQLEALVIDQYPGGNAGMFREVFKCPECGVRLVSRAHNMRDDETPLRDRLDQHLTTYCKARVERGRRAWENTIAPSPFTMMRLFPRWGYRALWDATHRYRALRQQFAGDPAAIMRHQSEEAGWLTDRFHLFCEAMGWYPSGVKHVVADAEGRTFFHTPPEPTPRTRAPRRWNHPAFRVACGLHYLGMTEAVDR